MVSLAMIVIFPEYLSPGYERENRFSTGAYAEYNSEPPTLNFVVATPRTVSFYILFCQSTFPVYFFYSFKRKKIYC